MMKQPIRNQTLDEEGSALLAVIVVLALLTIIGASTANKSNLEATINSNFSHYKRNFYLAEGAAMEAGQLLDGETNAAVLNTGARPWLNVPGLVTGTVAVDMSNEADWDSDGAGGDDTAQVATIDPTCEFSVVRGTPAQGSSLEDPLFTYHLYGNCGRQGGTGRSIIISGFRKRH
jgi:hypothetical protein